MTYRKFISATVLSLALVPGAAVFAQQAGNFSDNADEIAKAFKDQKTRSLVIAPGTDEGTAPADTPAETPADGTQIAAADPNYAEIDKEIQVNVQVQFDFDSATLRDAEKPKLSAVCEAMKSVDVEVFRIVGHTDSSGTDAYNQRLSLRRAEAVKDFMVSDCGISADRLQAVGVGEAHLYDEQNPRADVNRRVEFQVVS